MKNPILKSFTAMAALALPAMAQAGTVTSEDTFKGFYDTVKGWTNGALGTGIAMTMLLLGAGMGVARNSPMPALSGVAGAAFLKWGPEIIDNMMLSGALI